MFPEAPEAEAWLARPTSLILSTLRRRPAFCSVRFLVPGTAIPGIPLRVGVARQPDWQRGGSDGLGRLA